MAYEVLGKPEKLKIYDEFGEEGLQSGFDKDSKRSFRFERKRPVPNAGERAPTPKSKKACA